MSNSPQENAIPNSTSSNDIDWKAKFSGSAYNFRYLCLLVFSVIYWILLYHYHTFFVNTKLMPEYYWIFLISVPAFFWLKSLFSGLIWPVKIKQASQKNPDGTTSKKTVKMIFGWPKMICLLLFTIAFCGLGIYYRNIILNFVMTQFYYYTFVGGMVPLLMLLMLFLKHLYLMMTIHYELKGMRLYQKIGFFSINKDTTLVQQIRDTKLKYNWIDKYINGTTGTVILYTNDLTDPTLYLRGIKNPEKAQEIFDVLREQFANKRGISRFGGDVLENDPNDSGDVDGHEN